MTTEQLTITETLFEMVAAEAAQNGGDLTEARRTVAHKLALDPKLSRDVWESVGIVILTHLTGRVRGHYGVPVGTRAGKPNPSIWQRSSSAMNRLCAVGNTGTLKPIKDFTAADCAARAETYRKLAIRTDRAATAWETAARACGNKRLGQVWNTLDMETRGYLAA